MQLENATDEELMRLYQKGEDPAFSALYQRHASRVHAYLKRRVRDRAFAEDLFQAVFLKLHQSRSRYDPAFPFLPWLFTVCRSAMVDGLRARGTEELSPETVERAVDPASVASPRASPDLEKLSPDQRRAIELRYEKDLPFDEIAKRLGTSTSNARQLVTRAVQKLRKLAFVNEPHGDDP